MYFVVTDNEVVMIDGGDVLRSQEKYDSAKLILGAMTDGTTTQTEYTLRGNEDDIELSIEGGIAKVDTQEEPINAYVEHSK